MNWHEIVLVFWLYDVCSENIMKTEPQFQKEE